MNIHFSKDDMCHAHTHACIEHQKKKKKNTFNFIHYQIDVIIFFFLTLIFRPVSTTINR